MQNSEKLKIIEKFAKAAGDTGSIEVQIALLTKEIDLLTEHLIKHKKDFTSKRGLFAKVSKRKALLKYLGNHDVERLRKLASELKLNA